MGAEKTANDDDEDEGEGDCSAALSSERARVGTRRRALSQLVRHHFESVGFVPGTGTGNHKRLGRARRRGAGMGMCVIERLRMQRLVHWVRCCSRLPSFGYRSGSRQRPSPRVGAVGAVGAVDGLDPRSPLAAACTCQAWWVLCPATRDLARGVWTSLAAAAGGGLLLLPDFHSEPHQHAPGSFIESFPGSNTGRIS